MLRFFSSSQTHACPHGSKPHPAAYLTIGDSIFGPLRSYSCERHRKAAEADYRKARRALESGR